MSKQQEYAGQDLPIDHWIHQDKNLIMEERYTYAFYYRIGRGEKEQLIRLQPISNGESLNPIEKGNAMQQAQHVCDIIKRLMKKGYLHNTTRHQVNIRATELLFKCIKHLEVKTRPAASNDTVKGGLF